MNAPQMSLKAAVSVSEMCELCSISRSRWYEMVASGIFPKPVQLPSIKRPVYDRMLIDQCLQIKATGIGLNGFPVLFNRKANKSRRPKPNPRRPTKIQRAESTIETISAWLKKDFGLNTTSEAVDAAVAEECPNGIAEVDLGDVVRKVFHRLQAGKK